MSREIRFSFETAQVKLDFETYARAKGMTLSALAKMALYQYIERYPRKSSGAIGKAPPEVRAVQSGGLTGKG